MKPITTAAQALALLEQAGAMTLVPAGPKSAMPSLVGAVVGAPVKGSWWGHPKGKLIFALGTALGDAPGVLCAKLVAGKVTFVHARLVPALIRVVTDPAWRAARVRGLPASSAELLARLEEQGVVDDSAAPARKPLEQRALVHTASEHTDAGHHATVLTSWARWAKGKLATAARTLRFEDALAELAAAGIDLAAR